MLIKFVRILRIPVSSAVTSIRGCENGGHLNPRVKVAGTRIPTGLFVQVFMGEMSKSTRRACIRICKLLGEYLARVYRNL